MSGLVEKLEAAEVGSDLLSCDIGIALGEWTPPKGAERDSERPDVWRRDGIKYYQSYAEVSTSLDAALALAERVLPGWGASAIHLPGERCEGYVWPAGCHVKQSSGRGATPALALCIAILRALNLNETRHD